METRSITVKGKGNVKAKVDFIVITFTLYTLNQDYAQMMNEESNKYNELSEALIASGFKKGDIKTLDFDIQPRYESNRDERGNYKEIFKGYECKHGIKASFDYDIKRMNKIIFNIGLCKSNPKLNITFTVKEPTLINEELLRSAAINAKKKAEILCESSGCKLGQLLTIDYNWNEIYFESASHFQNLKTRKLFYEEDGIDIEPDDIDVSDTATFIWEIV